MSTSPHTSDTTPSSKPEMLHQEHKQPDRKIGLRSRLKHFTFAWFLSTMSTGGLALAIAETPHQFPGTHPSSIPSRLPILTNPPPRPPPNRPNPLHPKHPPLPRSLNPNSPPLPLPPHPLPHFLPAPIRILLPRLLLPLPQRHPRRHPNLRHHPRPRLPLAHRRRLRALLDLRGGLSRKLRIPVLDINSMGKGPSCAAAAESFPSGVFGDVDGDRGEFGGGESDG